LGLFETTLGSVAAASALAAYAWIASALLDRRWRDLADSATDLLPVARPRTDRDAYNRIDQALHGVRRRLDKNAAQIADLKIRLAAARSAGARADDAKRAFLGSVGHELRTPLNAIIGMSHFAMQTALSAQQFDYLERINRAANGLLTQIDNILDYVRLESGDLHIAESSFELDDVIDDIADNTRLAVGDKPLTVRVERDANIPGALIGDARRITQVLSQLTDNAVKFSDRGEVVIAVRLLGIDDTSARIAFEVRDTGIGIDHHRKGTYFAPFSPGDASNTRRHGGSGLGLVICHRLVTGMGGRLQAQCLPERGSRVGFTLALLLAERSPTTGGHHRKRTTGQPRLKRRAAKPRFSDDAHLMRRLLLRFSADYAGFIDEYRQLYESHDRFGASQLAHALASAAADLGDMELKHGAERLAMKRRGEDKPGADLRAVEQMLKDLLAEIDDRLDGLGNAAPTGSHQHQPKRSQSSQHHLLLSDAAGTASTAGSERRKIAASLQRLFELLTDFDATAINHFETLGPLLRGLASQTQIDTLQRAINGFDFTLALSRLDRLAADLGIPLRETT
jgi:signal transduction histidine kinase/HPt (histidine-containing phosphotransfer) domain-containing protein